MPSGYEKSDDYGGPPPGRAFFIVTAVVAGLVLARLFL